MGCAARESTCDHLVHALTTSQVEPNFDLMDDGLHNWRAMTAGDVSSAIGDADGEPAVAELPTDADTASASASALPLNDDGTLDFFWLDACEVQGSKGNIYLFGKVHPYPSVSNHARPQSRPCQSLHAHCHAHCSMRGLVPHTGCQALR
jgi:hypothetical protein